MRAVLFDLDGTLVNSLPEIAHGVNEALARQGKPALPDEKIAAMIGRGVAVLADRVAAASAPDHPDRDRLFRDIVEVWAESNGRGTVLFPDAAFVIAALRARNIRVGLVTNKLRDLTLSFLKDRGMEDWFDVVVAGDDCPQPKPAPDMILRALSQLEVSAEQAVMVGDSRNDALAARAAGVRAVLLTTGYNEGVSMEDWAKQEGFDAPYLCLSAALKTLCGEEE